MRKSKWNEHMTTNLKVLHGRGHSAREIAVKLNKKHNVELTRCAVLGKLFRLRLSGNL